jgi:hypothetical protein
MRAAGLLPDRASSSIRARNSAIQRASSSRPLTSRPLPQADTGMSGYLAEGFYPQSDKKIIIIHPQMTQIFAD